MLFQNKHKKELAELKQTLSLLEQENLQHQQLYRELQTQYEQLQNQCNEYQQFYDVSMTVNQKIVNVPELVEDFTRMPNAYKDVITDLLDAIAQSAAFDAVTRVKDKYYIPYIE